MDVSVLLATYDRAEMLRETLASFESLEVEGLNWEVIVVDNANDTATGDVAKQFDGRLPLRLLTETRRGKNFALNTGIEAVSGDLVVLTDDDIRADPKWLVGLWSAARRHPEVTMFAGKILPEFPGPGFEIQLPEEMFKGVFVVNDFGDRERQIPADKVWGPNMAIAGRIFSDGNRFDTGIGPSAGQYVMGSEIEFTMRLARLGHQALYVPDALVWHRIREEQLSVDWLEGRLFRMGRGQVALKGAPAGIRWFGVPRHLVREIVEQTALCWVARVKSDADGELEARLLRAYARGIAYQCKALTT